MSNCYIFNNPPDLSDTDHDDSILYDLITTDLIGFHAPNMTTVLPVFYMIAPIDFDVQGYRNEFISYIKRVIYEKD